MCGIFLNTFVYFSVNLQWSEWSNCSKSYELGTLKRVIEMQAANGGETFRGPQTKSCGPKFQHERLRGKQRKDLCQLKPYKVDFKKIGWNDMIRSPDGFDMGLCKGSCNVLPVHSEPTSHALLQLLYSKKGQPYMFWPAQKLVY